MMRAVTFYCSGLVNCIIVYYVSGGCYDLNCDTKLFDAFQALQAVLCVLYCLVDLINTVPIFLYVWF